jgi:hypothetical protein
MGNGGGACRQQSVRQRRKSVERALDIGQSLLGRHGEISHGRKLED